MLNRYYLYQRRSTGIYFIQDRLAKKHESLRTRDTAVAQRLFNAKNQAAEQPMLNVALAKVYLSGTSPEMATRTWYDVMHAMEQGYRDETLIRWRKAMRAAPYATLHQLPLVYTNSGHFLAVLHHPGAGTSTNKWLRILHNRALDLGWLLSPVMARKAWPPIRSKRMKAITQEQHEKLLETESDEEFRDYLEMLWHTGASQTDVARLHRRNIDLENRVLTYSRQKLEHLSQGHAAIAIGSSLAELLTKRPKEGLLFPKLAPQSEKIRASRFRKRADRLGFLDVSLHSYRYAWAQRAKVSGMPLREAMAHLGHGSRAIHQAYSEKAETVTLRWNITRRRERKRLLSSPKQQISKQVHVPERNFQSEWHVTVTQLTHCPWKGNAFNCTMINSLRAEVLFNQTYLTSAGESRQNDRQVLDLFVPHGKGPFPVAVWIHGGGWSMGDRKINFAPFFLEAGLALASIEYRLTSEGHPFPAQIEDCLAALTWLKENGDRHRLNVDQIGVFGHSAGAHLSALICTTGSRGEFSTSKVQVQAAVLWSGPLDLGRERGKWPENFFPWDPKDVFARKFFAAGLYDEEFAKWASPSSYVNGDIPPLLIVHGEKDTIVPLEQAEEFSRSAMAMGVNVAFRNEPEATHDLLTEDLFREAATFFKRTLQ